MPSLYGYLILAFVLTVIGVLVTVAARGRGISEGEAKGKAKEAIARITDAVNRGDDAEVQRLIEEKVHEK